MDRRTFLDRSWKVVVGVLGAEGLWTTVAFLRPNLGEGFGAPMTIAGAAGLPEGEVQYYSTGRFYMVRIDGDVLALYQKCPHLGCRVPYCASSGRFECPCHGSFFNRKGEYLKGPSPRGMDSFPVTVEGADVVVETGSVVDGPTKGTRTYREGEVGPSCIDEGGEHAARRRAPRAREGQA